MKVLSHIILVILLTSLNATSYAKCTQEEIRDFERAWAQAYNSNRAEDITNFFARDAIFIGAIQNTKPLVTQQARHDYFESLFHNAKQNNIKLSVFFDPKEEHVHLISGGAVANGINMLQQHKSDGSITKTRVLYSMVYRDTPHNCELILFHGSVMDASDKTFCHKSPTAPKIKN